jgi:hypothetical protein
MSSEASPDAVGEAPARSRQRRLDPPLAGRLGVIRPAAACVIAGLALYVTRGVLDQTVTATGVIRFAMLPPWQALVGFICLAALVLLGIDHLNAPRGTTTAHRPRLQHLVPPMFALAVLLLPFTPVLPDRWPALQALAGPLGAIVWLSVIALQMWVLWQSRLITARAIERWRLSAVTIAIFVATLAAAGFAAFRLTSTPLYPSGDEPHYLVISQSLLRDGDLKIENNHRRGDYREYYESDLAPHYLTRGSDAEIYSIHPIGVSVLIAPAYYLGGYRAVVAALIVIAAAAVAIAWRWTVATLNAPGAATFGWAAIVLTAPYLLNTFTVYPEIAGALAAIFAFVWTLPRPHQRPGAGRWIAAGLAIAVLPWLSTKYAPMSAALLVVVLLRLSETGPASFIRNSKAWMVIAIYAISLAAWFAFFYWIWGNPLPMAPYGSMTQTSPWNLRSGAPGLLFDQEYGLLALAPVYVLAATGLFRMWRSGGPLRRQALEITFVFAALLATVGAFGIWWGGSASPGRPIASGLPLLMLPIAAAFRNAPAGSPLRAGHHLLLWISIGVAATLVLAQDGVLVVNGRDGTSALLEYWSPRWELWSLAPTFLGGQPWAIGLLQSAWWLTIAAAAAFVLARARTAHAGASALTAAGTVAAALIVLAVTMPLLPDGRPVPRVDLGARSRLSALDGFDAHVRPAAMLYDPLRRGASTDVVARLTLGVKPMQRTDRQPLRVIHNGRFSLPAGSYRIDVQFNDRAAGRTWPLSLQVGRVGPPFETWQVEAQGGELWSTTLWLPVSASFVGLRGPDDLERAIDAITITPTAVVDAGSRPIVPVVVAAARYDDVSLFFHDERMYPEPSGFWTRGGRTSGITVATPPDRTSPVVLRFHSGAQPNKATFSTFGWSHEVSLTPGEAAEIELPTMAGGVVPLTITAEDGFYPRDLDPSSADQRFLGIWIEVKPSGRATAAYSATGARQSP